MPPPRPVPYPITSEGVVDCGVAEALDPPASKELLGLVALDAGPSVVEFSDVATEDLVVKVAIAKGVPE